MTLNAGNHIPQTLLGGHVAKQHAIFTMQASFNSATLSSAHFVMTILVCNHSSFP